jgi:hypothetical protein
MGSIFGKSVSAVLEVFSALWFGGLIEDGTRKLPESAGGPVRSISMSRLEF